jgi:hypothetical protein
MFVRQAFAFLGILLVLGLQGIPPSQAVVPGEGDPGYIFPPGKYILGGGPKAARGKDLLELQKPFRLRPGQFILSGGQRPTDRIIVDDDLEVSSAGKLLFLDDDHVPTTETRKFFQGFSCTYAGAPIILVLDPKARLCIQAIDHFANDAVVGELYLYRHDGARKRLTESIRQESNRVLPHVFFREEFNLDAGFTAAPSMKEVMEMPPIPAALLTRRPAAP